MDKDKEKEVPKLKSMPVPAKPPALIHAATLAEGDVGSCEWDRERTSELLSISADGLTLEWEPRELEHTPIWLRAQTRMQLHSGEFRWDFVVDEMAGAQIGVGFMLQWDMGLAWGFYGYLGASSAAWAYDPSTGDVVCDTRSIQGGLPKFSDGRKGVVSVRLNLPRQHEGSGSFAVNGEESRGIRLPAGAVIVPAACLLKKTQRVTLSRYERG